MKLQFCLGALLVASNLLVAHGIPDIKARSELDEKQKNNIVSVIQLTLNEEDLKKPDKILKLFEVVVEGIEKVAESILEEKNKGEKNGDEKTDNKDGEEATTKTGVKARAGAETGAQETVTPTTEKNQDETTDDVTTDDGATTATNIVPEPETGGFKTVFVVDTVVPFKDYDFSKPIEFFVTHDDEVMAATDFVDKAPGLKTEIETIAAEGHLDLKVAIVEVGQAAQGLAAWAIVLIVIAVILVVGAVGYYVSSYVRKRRGNSF